MRYSGLFFVLIALALFWLATEIQPNLDFTLDEPDEKIALTMFIAGFGNLILGFGLLCSRNPDYA